MILELINEAEASGARLEPAADIIGLSSRTVIRWRQSDHNDDQRKTSFSPPNKLDEKERMQIIDVANSAPFRDMSPKQIVPKLADQGIYIGSESSFYRVLKEQDMVKHRQPSKPATHKRPKEGCRTLSGVELGYHLPALTGAWHVFLPLHGRRCMEQKNNGCHRF